eukprot:16433815-Heterocapsa_arctica.AAC.1
MTGQDDCECPECGSTPKPSPRLPRVPTASTPSADFVHTQDKCVYPECPECGNAPTPSLVLPRARSAAAAAAAEASAQAYGE